jgi:hypothetical protein
MATNQNVMTPKFRASFANMFRPGKAMEDGQEPKYGVMMLFDKDADLGALKKAALEAVTDKWGPDKAKWPKNLRLPFRDQGEKEGDAYVKGAFFITATSKQKPGLVDQRNQPIIDEAEFYSGCYARATVRAFAYDKAGNRGVAFGLQNVQKLADGEPLGGARRKAEDEFEPISDDQVGGGTSADALFG